MVFLRSLVCFKYLGLVPMALRYVNFGAGGWWA